MTTYTNIIKKSIAIASRFKALLLFAFFGSIFISQNISYIINNIYERITDQGADWINLQTFLDSIPITIKQVTDNINSGGQLNSLSILIAIILILIILVLLTIANLSYIAIINYIYKVYNKIETSFFESLKVSHNFFWRISFINILLIMAFGVILKLLGIPLIFFSTVENPSILHTIISIISFVVLTILFFSYSIINLMLSIDVITKNNKLITAFKNAYKIFYNNWLVFLETSIMLFVIGMLLQFSITIIFSYSLIFPLQTLITELSSPTIKMTLALIILLFNIIIVIINTFFVVFQYSIWVLLYNETNTNQIKAKLLRIFNK